MPREAAHTAGRSWLAGPVYGLRPAFRELGAPAALAYEQLESAKNPLSRFDVAARAGLSATTAADALYTLAEHGLADPGRDGRRLGRACLRTLAEVFGVGEVLDAIRAQYAVERVAWRAKLAGWRQEHRALRKQAGAGPLPPAAPPREEPPPELAATVFDLLADRLGAYVVEPQYPVCGRHRRHDGRRAHHPSIRPAGIAPRSLSGCGGTSTSWPPPSNSSPALEVRELRFDLQRRHRAPMSCSKPSRWTGWPTPTRNRDRWDAPSAAAESSTRRVGRCRWGWRGQCSRCGGRVRCGWGGWRG